MPQRWILQGGGDNRKTPTSQQAAIATQPEKTKSNPKTIAHIADINTDRLQTTRALELVQNVDISASVCRTKHVQEGNENSSVMRTRLDF